MINLFNLDIEKIMHDDSIVVLMKLNGDVIYEYDGEIEYPYIEYTVDKTSSDPLNHVYIEYPNSSYERTYYYSLPEIYTDTSTNYNIDYKKVEITLLDGTTTNDMTTPCNQIEKVKLWFPQKVYSIKFTPYSSTYTNLTGLIYCNVSRMKSLKNMFWSCEKLESADISNFNTRNVTDMSYMFEDCTNLTTLDVSNFNTSNVISMKGMFDSCESLTTLDVSNFDTSNVTDMHIMFQGCDCLTTITGLNNFNTNKVTKMGYMFAGCDRLTTLDVSNFNTSNVISMDGMFRYCEGLTTLDVSNFDTSKVTDMSDMFNDCIGLTTLDVSNFDTSNVTDMDGMFNDCEGLTTLDLSNWDIIKATSIGNAFNNCTSLVDFNAPKNISANIDVSKSTELSHDSLMSIINNLATVTSTKKLTLGSTNLLKLTDDEIRIATAKGWTLA